MTVPRVSIVLVTKNGAPTLPALLDGIAAQRFDGAIEIVAVDSSSTDGSVDLLRPRVDQLISIAPDSFDHGLTRNLGIERARGAIVVLIVQDAAPASDTWLRDLVAPLDNDPGIAGAFARQIPRAESGALTRHYASRGRAASTTPQVAQLAGAEAFTALPPQRRFECCTFDNVCSCIRRSVWAKHPFPPAPFAEDLAWAKTVLLDGYRLAFEPSAVVIHSHDRSASHEFSRTRLLHRRLYDLFSMRTIPTGIDLARAIASSIALHLSIERSRRALALAFAWPLGQYLGARDAVKAATR